jgi:hypothetical protein
MTHNPRISRREWLHVFIFAIFIMLFFSLPYLIGFAVQHENWHFSGFVFNLTDMNSYLGNMRLSSTQDWLHWQFWIVYTPEPHDGAFVYIPYLLLGKIAALFISPASNSFPIALIFVFHGARVIWGILLVLTIYRFIAIFIIKQSMRYLALAIACLGGGLGWLLMSVGAGALFGTLPIDLYLPESFSAYLFYGLPHLSLARAALLGGLILTIRALHQTDYKWIGTMLLASLSWLVMALSVPFYIGVVAAILGSWGIAVWISSRRFPQALFIRCIVGSILPLPYLVYTAWVFTTNPIMRTWSSQNILYSPHPLHYVFGYGVPAILAAVALRWAWVRGKRNAAYLLPAAWITVAPVLAYLPINVQRRMLESVYIPLIVLAVMGLRIWWLKWRRSSASQRPRRARTSWQLAMAAMCFVLLPSTLILVLAGVPAALTADSQLGVFHTNGEIAALDWINANIQQDSVILAEMRIANYAPARANIRTYVGHGPEAVDYIGKLAVLDRFFAQQMTDNEIMHLFKQYTIRYVVCTPDNPDLTQRLFKSIYSADGWRIYEFVGDKVNF